MAIIKDKTVKVFDLDEVNVGDLMYIKETSWSCGRTGIVIAVNESQMTLKYHPPDVPGVINDLVISAADINAGNFTIRWSSDLVTIKTN